MTVALQKAEVCRLAIEMTAFLLCVHLSFFDLRCRRIPNRSLVAGFMLLMTLALALCPEWPWPSHLLSALFFLAFFGAIAWLWPAAVGMGDVKLAVLLCFVLGFRPFVFLLTTASLAALFVSLIFVLGRRTGPDFTLPFAPFLTAGLLLWILFSQS